MKKLLIKNGLLLSPEDGLYQMKKDILIENGKIVKIADQIDTEAEIVDCTDCMVTPGLIDIHTHCFADASLGIAPDTLGIERFATTILDAGSSGAYNFEQFKEKYIDQAKTRVFALLNVSKEGLIAPHELDSLEKIDRDAIAKIIKQYPDQIVGLKARASASVVGEMGITPIQIAAEIAQEVNRPLMVHVGNYPPSLQEVLDLLNKGDIVTHAYHGKKGNILDEEGKIIKSAIKARDRGVLFDIGHGSASFCFDVFKQALSLDFDCDLISTDLHVENYNGPVNHLPDVMSKMLECQESLENIIRKVTSVPADHYQLKGLGHLKEGYYGDLSIMKLVPSHRTVKDSMGNELVLQQEFKVCATVLSREENSEVFRNSNSEQ